MNMDLHEEQSQREVVTKSSYASGKSSSKRGTECSSSKTKKKMKFTFKDQKMHHLIFEEGGLADGTEVVYDTGKKKLPGYKHGHQICCSCCEEMFSPSLFETHAGMGSRRKPYHHIFLSNGMSLHEYAISLRLNCKNVRKKNDTLCRVCKMSGDLLLCEGCPRSFHRECIEEPVLRLEKWFCTYCKKSLGLGPKANAKRSLRITDNLNNHEIIACVLCRACDFSDDGFSDRTVIVCDQCEKEYHIGCLRVHKEIFLQQLPHGNWFCTMDCQKLHEDLNDLDTNEPEPVGNPNRDVKWIIRRGKDASKENKHLLKEAVKIFHECFDPIIDSVTRDDYIPSMAYGLQMGASNFSGVHCAMITINSKVITAGMFRILGHEIAELSIVATSEPNRGKGYFQLFLKCFERLLSDLQVKKLVVPAAEDTKTMWTKKFGFRIVNPKQLSEYQQTHTSMVAFHGTTLLEKEILEGQRIVKNDEVISEHRSTKTRQRNIKNSPVASSSVDPQDHANELPRQKAPESSLLNVKDKNKLLQRVIDLECQLDYVKNELEITRLKLEKSESEKSDLQKQVQELQILRN